MESGDALLKELVRLQRSPTSFQRDGGLALVFDCIVLMLVYWAWTDACEEPPGSRSERVPSKAAATRVVRNEVTEGLISDSWFQLESSADEGEWTAVCDDPLAFMLLNE